MIQPWLKQGKAGSWGMHRQRSPFSVKEKAELEVNLGHIWYWYCRKYQSKWGQQQTATKGQSMGIHSGIVRNLWLLFVALGIILMAPGRIFIISRHLTSVTSMSLLNYPPIHSPTNMFQVMQCWSLLGTLGFLYTSYASQPLFQNNMEGWMQKAFLGHGCWGSLVSYQVSTLKNKNKNRKTKPGNSSHLNRVTHSRKAWDLTWILLFSFFPVFCIFLLHNSES